MSDIKTFAVRLDSELHARLTLLAKLSGRSATDIIRAGIETQLDTMSKAPEIAARAAELQDELTREATAQQAALAALVGDHAKQNTAPSSSRRTSPGSK
ncbi:ribbon-helix-helix protein, CopG family [Rudaeicoccus suwonensis]|uniref:Ribbon-helix-helix CopG family protein n=1 Tax=Rudaeicoccus suwonensis TaxID=657409 RepID=A0A561EAD8_9MICO|nr:ribbon-helix-helix protein, CopG family [Rudaeicoccus suwonensis]TWE12569.1 ribbon-helix-helix CopG family protein [Rudaeicoccus suwonensis]